MSLLRVARCVGVVGEGLVMLMMMMTTALRPNNDQMISNMSRCFVLYVGTTKVDCRNLSRPRDLFGQKRVPVVITVLLLQNYSGFYGDRDDSRLFFLFFVAGSVTTEYMAAAAMSLLLVVFRVLASLSSRRSYSAAREDFVKRCLLFSTQDDTLLA
jgi:hypothetical protein